MDIQGADLVKHRCADIPVTEVHPFTRRNMETLSQAMFALTVVFAAVAAAVALRSTHRDFALWMGCAGAVCAVIAFFAWLQGSYWKDDSKRSPTDKHRDRFITALNNPIRDIAASFHFKRPLSVRELVPLQLGFEIRWYDHKNERTGVVVGVTDETRFQFPGRQPYIIRWAPLGAEKVHRQHGFVIDRENVTTLTIPLRLTPLAEGEIVPPLKTLEGAVFRPRLSDAMIKQVSRIELSVNDWVLCSVDPSTAAWRSSPTLWPVFSTPPQLCIPFDSLTNPEKLPASVWKLQFADEVPEYRVSKKVSEDTVGPKGRVF
jgi:hypothetical protein